MHNFRAGACALIMVISALLFGAEGQAADFRVFDGKTVPTIVHDGADGAPLANAAALLGRDLTALTGAAPTIATGADGVQGPVIIVGTMSTPAIARLIEANGIDTAPIAGKWETYGRAVIASPANPKATALLIFGSDVRGAIWGVADLTREMGVSPWEWWADVTIRKRDRIAVSGDLRYSREPSVRYRAIFLNDEDFGLFPWAAKTYDAELGDIGPKTYERIFELMWRLKANAIWPAMHNITTPFNMIAGNPEMAASYAIVHATSHAEPMLRNNVREWDEKAFGEFNYLKNRETILAYWDKRAEESKGFENIYTVGLRGIHDSPMEGVDGANGRAKVLADVIGEQRKILERRHGKPASDIPQAFTAYKEVLEAYDAGLEPPDDIMLTWPDDNFGYIRRLSNAKERARAGGSGVYYHISYWGPPMSYLWLATTHPALLWSEMNKAYRFDAKKIWVLNVGDIKPGEYLTELFLDMAFDNEAFPDAAAVKAHLKRWSAENFGPANAAEIADILWRYHDLAFARRPEFMGFNDIYPNTPVRQTDFNTLAWGDEAQKRLDAYADIEARAAAMAKKLPEERKDAFYQLVQYSVSAAAALDSRVLNLDKSVAYARQHRASASRYAQRAKEAQGRLVEGARVYNEDMSRGKWRGMMDIRPHRLPVYAAPDIPAWTGDGVEGCAVQTEGGHYHDNGGSTPYFYPFQRELKRERYVDVFLRAPGAADWSASATAPWVKISRKSGRFSGDDTEARLTISIDWKSAPKTGEAVVNIACSDGRPIPIGVSLAPPAPKGVSFVESERVVSIYATNADVKTDGWEVIDGLGHTGASLRSKLDLASVDDPDKAPSATYRFATANDQDKATLRAFVLPTLPITSDNGMRIAVAIDGGAPIVLGLATKEFSAEWKQNVLRNSAIGEVNNLRLAPGAHELKVYALDPGVTLDRFEIAFMGAQPAYGPIPETRIAP